MVLEERDSGNRGLLHFGPEYEARIINRDISQ